MTGLPDPGPRTAAVIRPPNVGSRSRSNVSLHRSLSGNTSKQTCASLLGLADLRRHHRPITTRRFNLSESEFARLIGVSVKTLQNWEQDRRRPTGPADTFGSFVNRPYPGRPYVGAAFWRESGMGLQSGNVSLDFDGLPFVNCKSEGGHQKSHIEVRPETPRCLGVIDELVSDHPSRQLAKPC